MTNKVSGEFMVIQNVERLSIAFKPPLQPDEQEKVVEYLSAQVALTFSAERTQSSIFVVGFKDDKVKGQERFAKDLILQIACRLNRAAYCNGVSISY